MFHIASRYGTALNACFAARHFMPHHTHQQHCRTFSNIPSTVVYTTQSNDWRTRPGGAHKCIHTNIHPISEHALSKLRLFESSAVAWRTQKLVSMRSELWQESLSLPFWTRPTQQICTLRKQFRCVWCAVSPGCRCALWIIDCRWTIQSI